MPTLTIQTSLTEKDVPRDFLLYMTYALAKALGKPIENTLVHLMPNQKISFGGVVGEPTALCELTLVEVMERERNEERCRVLTAELGHRLGIADDRIFFTFTALPGSHCGIDGSTVVGLDNKESN